MIPSPWKRLAEPEPGTKYLVLLTYLPLLRHGTIPRFLRDTRRIAEQLEGTRGVIGYSLKANPLWKDFWTLSAWENEVALRGFSYNGVHRDVMLSLKAEMGETKFTRWTVWGRDLPPTWKNALAREAVDTS